MKYYFTLFIILIISLHNSFAQSPTIEWQNTIGGSNADKLFSIQQTIDGGYILGGWSESDISGDKTESSQGDYDYWIVKLNATGQNIEWQNTIGGNDTEVFNSIQQTNDNGYILGGYSRSDISGDKTESSQGGYDYWVVKLDATGQVIEWQKTIGGSDRDDLISIQKTLDNGYIIGGESSSGISGDKTEGSQGSDDYWIVKIDATGQVIEWQKTIGGDNTDRFSTIKQTTDGGYILGGYSRSEISGDKTESSQGGYDYWVVKLDVTGQTIEWQSTIGGSETDRLMSIQQTKDGGYILGGYSGSGISGDKTEDSQGDWDYWIVKIDATGQTIEWQNTIGGNDEEALYNIQQTNDNGYIIGGYSESEISGDKTESNRGDIDYWIVKLDENGVIVWDKTIGGNNLDLPKSIQQTTDGGYIIGGYSESEIFGDKTETSQGTFDYWVVKLYGTFVSIAENDYYKPISSEITVLLAYPNPFNPRTTITYGLDRDSNVNISIYDITGQLITTLQNENQTQGWHSTIWNGTNYNNEQVHAGIYLCKITTNNTTKTTKLLLLK